MLSTVELMSITTKTTKADLERELRRVTALANDNHNELQSFKTLVVNTALEAKASADWCDEGFKEAMQTLGLEIPSRYRRITLVVDVDLTDPDGPTEYDEDYLAEVDDDDVIESVLEAVANKSLYDRATVHTLKVEIPEDEPDTVLTEVKQTPRRSSYNSYNDYNDPYGPYGI